MFFFSVDFLFSLKWIFLLWIYLLSASIVFQFVVYPIVPCIWIGKTKGRRRGKLWHLFFVIYDNFSQFSTKAPTVITILVSISFNWKYHKKYHPHRNWLMISQFKFKRNRIFHSSIRLTRMNDTSLSNNKKNMSLSSQLTHTNSKQIDAVGQIKCQHKIRIKHF